MAEFKKLSEVELLETASDNATVLVEEGGEIKRVAKSEVGGAGGYFLTLSESNCEIDWGNYDVLCNENYDALYDVLIAGGSAWIDFAFIDGTPSIKPYISVSEPLLPEPTNYAGCIVPLQVWWMTDVGMFVVCELWGDEFRVCFPNGSHNLEPQQNLPS